MTQLGVTAEEAAAIHEYLRAEASDAGEATSAVAPAAHGPRMHRPGAMDRHHMRHHRAPATPAGSHSFKPTGR